MCRAGKLFVKTRKKSIILLEKSSCVLGRDSKVEGKGNDLE